LGAVISKDGEPHDQANILPAKAGTPNHHATGISEHRSPADNPTMAPAGAMSALAFDAAEVEREPSLLAVTTLVLWAGCLVVGVLGLSIACAQPKPPPRTDAPVQAEILHVELTHDPLPPPEAPKTDPIQLPPEPVPLVAPAVPPPIQLASATAEVAFALPQEGPAQTTETLLASYSRQSAPAPTAPPPVQTITFGRGEGKQPAPDYPVQAKREGQEGTVVLRFRIAENGRVLDATAVSPCVWPLLNEAAVRVVRDRWRFPAGSSRLCEVSIRFQLLK